MLNKFVAFLSTKSARTKAFDSILNLCINLLDLPNSSLKIAAVESLSHLTAEIENNDKLIETLIKCDFLNAIFYKFSEDLLGNSELIIIFMIQHDKYTAKDLSIMWKCLMDNISKSGTKAIIKLWNNILPYCNKNIILNLGNQLRKIPINKYNESLLTFIDCFAKYAEALNKTTNDEVFNSQFLWNYAFDKQFPLNLKEKALDIFVVRRYFCVYINIY